MIQAHAHREHKIRKNEASVWAEDCICSNRNSFFLLTRTQHDRVMEVHLDNFARSGWEWHSCARSTQRLVTAQPQMLTIPSRLINIACRSFASNLRPIGVLRPHDIGPRSIHEHRNEFNARRNWPGEGISLIFNTELEGKTNAAK